jgi:transmembrane sensor
MKEELHNDKLSAEEFRELDAEQKILRYSATYNPPFTVTKERALQELKARIALGETLEDAPKTNVKRAIYWISSAAAFLLLAFGIWHIWLRKPMVDVIAAKGLHNEYLLPDSSLVSMNAETKITYRKGNFKKERYLTLEGEAFFSVKKGKKFTINTKFADIKILGTSFNVFAREEMFKVTCVTGKVSVTSGNQSVIITPGESVTLNNQALVKYYDKNINTVANWRMGDFYFENTPLSFVFREIERQFNVTFEGENMNNKFFTGSFSNKNLVNALDIVCLPMGVTYEIGSNSKILIKEKPH